MKRGCGVWGSREVIVYGREWQRKDDEKVIMGEQSTREELLRLTSVATGLA